MTVPSSAGSDAPPRWFDLTALVGPVLIATVGTFGLLLAILGVYSTAAALAVGLPTGAAMLWGVWRMRPAPSGRGDGRRTHVAAGLAVALAVGYFVFAAWAPSQNVIATRDPGLYMGTARWLSTEGSLEADAKADAFAGVDGLKFESAGVYDMGGGRLEFQFNHLSSVVLSVGLDVGGYRTLFRMPALATAAGLLALYAVTVRVTRRPYVSLIAPALLAAAMPFLYVSRNTYSEPFAFALLWGVALALADLHRRPRITSALVGGTLLGALVSTRVDALLYVALVFPLAAVSFLCAAPDDLRRRRGWAWLTAIAATAVVGSVGIVDLLEWTGRYATDLHGQLSMLRKALAASAVASLVLVLVGDRVRGVRSSYERFRAPLAIGAAAVIVVLMCLGWFVRPLVQEVHSRTEYEAVANIQRAEGVEVDPTRIYSEDSLRWMAWYLGAPTVAAAIAGLALLAYLAVRRGRVSPAGVGVLVLTLAAGALYWWKPSITPDHLWATRRFVPAVLPGLAVVATVPVGLLAEWWRSGSWVRHLTLGALSALLVVPPAATTWPVRWQREQYGYLNPVLEACELMPDDAAVVVLGGYAGATLPHTLRSWCEVPVAAQGSVDAERVPEVAEQIAANGYRMVLLSADSQDLRTFLDVAEGEPRATNSAADHWMVRRTLDHVPSEYTPYERSLPVELPFRLHVLVVDED